MERDFKRGINVPRSTPSPQGELHQVDLQGFVHEAAATWKGI